MKEKMHASKRVFKTSWFTKAAKKARIKDEALCAAIRQVINEGSRDTCKIATLGLFDDSSQNNCIFIVQL